MTNDVLRAFQARQDEEVDDAERTEIAAGKERFDLAQIEQLLGAEPGSRAESARTLRRQYYLVHTRIRTLADYAALLRDPTRYE